MPAEIMYGEHLGPLKGPVNINSERQEVATVEANSKQEGNSGAEDMQGGGNRGRSRVLHLTYLTAGLAVLYQPGNSPNACARSPLTECCSRCGLQNISTVPTWCSSRLQIPRAPQTHCSPDVSDAQ